MQRWCSDGDLDKNVTTCSDGAVMVTVIVKVEAKRGGPSRRNYPGKRPLPGRACPNAEHSVTLVTYVFVVPDPALRSPNDAVCVAWMVQ